MILNANKITMKTALIDWSYLKYERYNFSGTKCMTIQYIFNKWKIIKQFKNSNWKKTKGKGNKYLLFKDIINNKNEKIKQWKHRWKN